jgi:hypothetical protein
MKSEAGYQQQATGRKTLGAKVILELMPEINVLTQ